MKEETFGHIIRELRINNKDYSSLREFARKVGLSPAYLSRIENEKEPPPSEKVIEKLAEASGQISTNSSVTQERFPWNSTKPLRRTPREWLLS